jgi:tyrosine-specific transport protein
MLIISWAVMTAGAFCILEVNFWLAPDSNMISMADKTLGVWGKLVTWVIYLLLLYSLICAYLSGISDVIQGLLAYVHINIPRWLSTFSGLLLFGFVVQRGIAVVDVINRGLMSVKFMAFFLLILFIIPNININYLFVADSQWQTSAFTLMMTSFGYAIIVPSLRSYLNNDKRLLKKVMIIGSLIPLVIYTLWILAIQGLIPRTGSAGGLLNILTSENMNSMLMNSMSFALHSSVYASIVKLFIAICALTSFLGVSVCLTDFIADGLSIKKVGKASILLYLITYLPPLLVVLISPGIFIFALNYAGLWCCILLIIIPFIMFYTGHKKHTKEELYDLVKN